MLPFPDEPIRPATAAVTMVNCDDDRSEDSVMALSDLSQVHTRALYLAVDYLHGSIDAMDMGKLEEMYLKLALASKNIDDVLAVIEDPKDKPRNKSPNGPLRASKNG